MRILHLTETTLAGAPAMLSNALESIGVDSRIIQTGHHKSAISRNDKVTLLNGDKQISDLEEQINDCDILHIHNQLHINSLRALSSLDKLPKIVYHVHSPYGEPPIFTDLSKYYGLPISKKLVVPHFHPRFFQDHELIPNCLFRDSIYKNNINIRKEADMRRILYSPSTNSIRRWSKKTDPQFQNELRAIRKSGFEVVVAKGLAPEKVDDLRRTTSFSIDEVVTGSYHLVTYEALATGNIAINGADDFSIECFKLAFKTSSEPPFFTCNQYNLFERIKAFEDLDLQSLRRMQWNSYEYFWDVMQPARVAQMYKDMYENI